MDRNEANAIIHNYLDDLEATGYAALIRRVKEDQAFERLSNTGATYQLEVSILWDDKPNGAIRILVSIDDGGLRAFLPLTASRLVEPTPGSADSTAQLNQADSE